MGTHVLREALKKKRATKRHFTQGLYLPVPKSMYYLFFGFFHGSLLEGGGSKIFLVVGRISVEIFPLKTISSMLHLQVIACF